MKEILIGVDNGNGNTKGDTGFVIQSGVKKLVVRPPFDTKTVKWKGEYYAVGASKMEIQKSKVSNNDTLILTMAAIAEKLNRLGKDSGDIRLAIGLPLTRMGAEKQEFYNYFMKNRRLNYKYEGQFYSVYIVSVDVFPQGYAAVVNRLNTFAMSTVVVDIGSWTIDILPIIEGQPDVSQCKSLSLGTFTAIADINENLRQKFGEEANEVIIKDVMLHGKSAINQKYLTIIQDGLTVYADKIMNNLRSIKINFDLTQFVFIGGGASIIKNFSSDLGENMLIVEDVCINAKGYKDILEHKYKVVV